MDDNRSKISPSEKRESKLKILESSHSHPSYGVQQEEVLSQDVFHSLLALERRRSERSGKPFVLMLLDANIESRAAERILKQAVDIVVSSKRETDLVGWYRRDAILGIIFTEVALELEEVDLPVTETLRAKVVSAFVKHMGRERASGIAVSVHISPESWDKNSSGWVEDSQRYSDLKRKVSRRRQPVSSTA